jgi:hypothetical protein
MSGSFSSDPLNPYAPSAVAVPQDPLAAAGVGCWRHGSLLVLHEDALLPPLCVKTGKPAAEYRRSPLRWSHPLRWPREYVQFDVPLSPRPIFWYGRGRPLVLVLAAAATLLSTAAAAAGIALIESAAGSGEVATMIIVVGVITVCCVVACWSALAQPLWVVRRKKKYYWLSGAKRRFLEQLPSWPYG